jgi:hypothetical protein
MTIRKIKLKPNMNLVPITRSTIKHHKMRVHMYEYAFISNDKVNRRIGRIDLFKLSHEKEWKLNEGYNQLYDRNEFTFNSNRKGQILITTAKETAGVLRFRKNGAFK